MMGNDAAEGGGAVQGHNAREAEATGQAPAPLPAQRPRQGVHHGQRPRPLIPWQAASHPAFPPQLPQQPRFCNTVLHIPASYSGCRTWMASMLSTACC